jgi:antitoxin ParD1/3/4
MFFFLVRAQTMGNRGILNVKGILMPTRNVNLTDELDSFFSEQIESGRYENASEVVRVALRTLEREEKQFEAKLVALRAAIDEGHASGAAEGDSFGRIRQKLQLSKETPLAGNLLQANEGFIGRAILNAS